MLLLALVLILFVTSSRLSEHRNVDVNLESGPTNKFIGGEDGQHIVEDYLRGKMGNMLSNFHFRIFGICLLYE